MKQAVINRIYEEAKKDGITFDDNSNVYPSPRQEYLDNYVLNAFNNLQYDELLNLGFEISSFKVLEFASENYGAEQVLDHYVAKSDDLDEEFSTMGDAIQCCLNWADAYLNSDDN